MWKIYHSLRDNAPILGSNTQHDLAYSAFRRKQKVYEKIGDRLTVVGLSSWLAECATQSTLLRRRRVVNLPNPLDINRFRPFSKHTARELLGLPVTNKLILFGAVNSMTDPRKGYSQLSEALAQIKRKDINLMVFGGSQPRNLPDMGFPVNYIGQLKDEISLMLLYNAADVMVVPSLQENLSNVIMESLSCGTPVVCFDIGGNSDMVIHQINGYLVQPSDPFDLSKGIEWILDHPDKTKLSQSARDKILREFDSRLVVKKYLELYTSLL